MYDIVQDPTEEEVAQFLKDVDEDGNGELVSKL
eukprot:SAG11_NODE_35171_length_268_cov_0.603550_1_plen_32_part_10